MVIMNNYLKTNQIKLKKIPTKILEKTIFSRTKLEFTFEYLYCLLKICEK